ncbi:MAG: NAD(P)/FAD-dependent oxidoreductase [Paracoccaceae bacterium]
MPAEPIDALVIGAGPAGLMAADALARAGRKVVLVEAKPSPARKFLMAGKSGLNLTKDEPFDDFMPHFGAAEAFLRPILKDFDPEAVKAWAQSLGQEVFTGSSGRVFPRAMKASPLLRAWLADLGARGVELRRGWKWCGWDGDALAFDTPNGPATLAPTCTVLALGGGSWARLGSDGAWAQLLADKGIKIAPFTPANAGLRIDWSDHMRRHFGAPLKGIALSAGDITSRGEAMISKHGLEGGGIYTLSPALRDGAPLQIDLRPDVALEALSARLNRPRGKTTQSSHIRKSAQLDPAKLALLLECARPLPQDGAKLAALIKALPVPYSGLAPMDEAISTAGGIALSELTDDLELRALPGLFAAGEMLDWEAPTGGYLITASLATGLRAGQAAARLR